MNSASMWGRPIKVGRPTQAQPYIKTIDSTIADTRHTTCLYVANIHPVSGLFDFWILKMNPKELGSNR